MKFLSTLSILLLFPGALPADPPDAAALARESFRLAGLPAKAYQDWLAAYRRRIAAARKQFFLVRPPLLANGLCREVLADPLAAPALMRRVSGRLEEAFAGAAGLARALAPGEAVVRKGAAALADDRGRTKPPPPTLEGLKSLLKDLHTAWQTGPGKVGKPERLCRNLEAITERFIRHIYIHNGADRKQVQAMAATLKAAGDLDLAPLRAASARLVAAASDPSWRKSLARHLARRPARSRAPGVEGRVRLDESFPWGRLVVGGGGANRYAAGEIACIVDLGGDDIYRGPAAGARGPERPLAVVLDLGGDDTYGKADACQGAGLLGAGILVDAAGDDTYEAGRRAQGFALAGVGILADLAGDDRYRGGELCQGAALVGTGILLDRQGKDLYEGWLYCQGFGGPGGLGALLEGAGDDTFRACEGPHLSSYPEDRKKGERNSMSQGVAVGFRQVADGGLGVLLDRAGSDRRRVGQFSCGGGYFFGLGLVHDRAGDDEYRVARYGGAFAPHQAAGFLLDDAGDDLYESHGTACLAGTWDMSLAFLVDGGGDDRYRGVGICLGGATICSLSLLIDAGGRDDYRVKGGGATALGSGGHPQDAKAGTRSLGIFLDLGGGRDAFTFTGKVAHPREPGHCKSWEVTRGKEKKPVGWALFRDRK